MAGTVIKATPDGKVTINGGENAGLKNGDILVVIRKGEEMKDPETGEVLGSEETTVAEIKVSDVKPKYAVADLVTGSGVQANDKVKVKKIKQKRNNKRHYIFIKYGLNNALPDACENIVQQ